MKRLAVLIAFVTLAALSLAACSAAPKGPPLKVTVGTNATYPPFEQIDRNTKSITGFDIELMNAIAAKQNLQVDYTSVDFNKLLTGMPACQFDAAIAAITVTDERRAQMAFSTPYYSAGQVVVAKKDNAAINGRDALSGKTVGVQSGTLAENEAKNIAGAKLKPYRNYNQAFNDLINGFIDAVVTDKPTAYLYINEAANGLKIAGDEFGKEDYAIAVCSQKADLLKRLNDGLTAVKADGTLDKLTQKWIVKSGK